MWLNAMLWLGIVTVAPWFFIPLRLNIRPEVYDTGLKYRITVPRFPPLGMSDGSTYFEGLLASFEVVGTLTQLWLKKIVDYRIVRALHRLWEICLATEQTWYMFGCRLNSVAVYTR